MRADSAWAHSRVAILKQMWADGATAAAIAECLGISRSAVLGKIFRLRLRAGKKEQAAAQAPCEPATPKRRRAVRQRRQRRLSRPRRRGISLLELTNATCRWPHGEPGRRGFFFCGAPGADLEGGRPYCACHARRAYSGAAISAEDGGSPVVRNSPPIAPLHARRSYVWRALVKHPAQRWR